MLAKVCTAQQAGTQSGEGAGRERGQGAAGDFPQRWPEEGRRARFGLERTTRRRFPSASSYIRSALCSKVILEAEPPEPGARA